MVRERKAAHAAAQAAAAKGLSPEALARENKEWTERARVLAAELVEHDAKEAALRDGDLVACQDEPEFWRLVKCMRRLAKGLPAEEEPAGRCEGARAETPAERRRRAKPKGAHLSHMQSNSRMTFAAGLAAALASVAVTRVYRWSRRANEEGAALLPN